MGSDTSFKQKIQNFIQQLPNLRRALQIVKTAAPGWAVSWFCLLIVQGALPVFTVYLVKLIVDSVTRAFGPNPQPEQIRNTLMLVAIMIFLQLLSEVLRATTTWVRSTVSELVQDYTNKLIHDHSVAIDLSFYESPEFYDHLHIARYESTYRPVALIENISSVIQNFFTLVAMAIVLIRFGIWIPLALFLCTLPSLIVAVRYVEMHHDWSRRNAKNVRWALYFSNIMTMREAAPEIRLFDLGSYFSRTFDSLREKIRTERFKLYRDQRTAEIIAGVTGYIISGAALSWMVWSTVKARFTLGELALFYQAFNQGQKLMSTLLENLTLVYKNTLFLGNLFEFLELKPKVVSPPDFVTAPTLLESGIAFKNVTFRYPGSDRIALKDFNLQISAGQIVAIVGPNGAGKSTLLKLICRFYDPDEGSLEFDGHDLRTFGIDQLRRMITVLFQEPVRYNATARENISLGDLRAEAQDEDIFRAARNAGADEVISKLPMSYDTLLGKWFLKGSELSVGEWQRVALARAFLRQAPIILLDEPTSSMDSWAEEDWMNRLRQLLIGCTGIIITHRFTTAMKADVIYVMQDGQITESGTHKELLEGRGQYAHSWEAQMRERSL